MFPVSAETSYEALSVTAMTTITEAHRERFTYRDCHLLAAAIHRRTGWPLHAVALPEEDGHLTPNSAWAHAFVRMPDGRCLDVSGPRDGDDLLDDYAPFLDAELYALGESHRIEDIGVYEVTAQHLCVEGVTLDAECEAVAAHLLANLGVRCQLEAIAHVAVRPTPKRSPTGPRRCPRCP